MRHTISKSSFAAAILAAATFAVPAFAADKKQDNRQDGGSAAQALTKVTDQQKAEADRQGSRKVEVQEKAIWGLGELPPKLMSRACEELASEPGKASLAIMQSANILDLTAAIGKDRGDASKDLMKQAEMLREVARKVETRQILDRKELGKPFAAASLAAAKYYQSSAEAGLKANDEEQTGYSLMGASGYLTAAHVFGQQKPSAEVSRAAYDANLVATQIVKNSKPTTVTGETKASGDRGQDKSGDAGDKANIPEGTEQIVSNLKQAIDGVTLGDREGRADAND